METNNAETFVTYLMRSLIWFSIDEQVGNIT